MGSVGSWQQELSQDLETSGNTWAKRERGCFNQPSLLPKQGERMEKEERRFVKSLTDEHRKALN